MVAPSDRCRDIAFGRSRFLLQHARRTLHLYAVLNIDRNPCAELVRAMHARVLRLCDVLLSNPEEAKDAAQDVIVKAFQCATWK